MIKIYNDANEEIVKQIRELESLCKQHDQLRGNVFLDTSINYNPDIKSLFLLYEDNKLVSFLSLFMPTSDEAEVSAFTLPAYRRNGYYKALLEEAIQELNKYNIPEVVLVCESQSIDGKKAIESQKVIYDFTEYFLTYKCSFQERENDKISGMTLGECEKEDLDSLIHLSQEIFEESYDDAKSMITKSFEAENRIQYKAVLCEKLVGMVAVSFEKDEASIVGLGVSPSYQGKGFGGYIVMLVIEELRNKGKDRITIEVDSTNKRAFDLYKRCGFEVETSFDYYRKKILS